MRGRIQASIAKTAAVAVTAAVTTLLAGCGLPQSQVQLGQADNGKVLNVGAGSTIVVSLGSGFQSPTSSNPAVLRPGLVFTPLSGIIIPQSTVFQAAATGRATLSANGIPNCPPGVGCMPVHWGVTVNVWPLQIDATNHGATFTVPQGSSISLVFDSTYWQFHGSSNPAVVAVTGTVVDPKFNGIPGIGTGTITVSLKAVAPGQASVSAVRYTCGEALSCNPPQIFTVTIDVS